MSYELRLFPRLHTCADEAIIVTRKSWVVDHVGSLMGQMGRGSQCDPLSTLKLGVNN